MEHSVSQLWPINLHVEYVLSLAKAMILILAIASLFGLKKKPQLKISNKFVWKKVIKSKFIEFDVDLS